MIITRVTYPNFRKTPPTIEVKKGRGCVRDSHKTRSMGVQPLSPQIK